MSSWARPGVKCVSLITFRDLHGAEYGPIENGVYTIRDVVMEADGTFGLRFAEILNNPFDYEEGFNECTFAIERFRPLITKTQEQDVELFRHLLDTAPERVSP